MDSPETSHSSGRTYQGPSFRRPSRVYRSTRFRCSGGFPGNRGGGSPGRPGQRPETPRLNRRLPTPRRAGKRGACGSSGTVRTIRGPSGRSPHNAQFGAFGILSEKSLAPRPLSHAGFDSAQPPERARGKGALRVRFVVSGEWFSGFPANGVFSATPRQLTPWPPSGAPDSASRNRGPRHREKRSKAGEHRFGRLMSIQPLPGAHGCDSAPPLLDIFSSKRGGQGGICANIRSETIVKDAHLVSPVPRIPRRYATAPLLRGQKKFSPLRNSLALMSFSFPPLVRGAGGIDGLESHQCTNIFDSALMFAHIGQGGEFSL